MREPWEDVALGRVSMGMSPYQLRAFYKWPTKDWFKVFKQYVKPKAYTWIIPVVVSYLIYDSAIKENTQFHRKDPKEFEHDV